MSMRPKASRQALTIAATSLLFVTSQRCVRMVFARFFVSTSRFASRSTANTFAPSCAKRTAVARPLPQPGPTEPAPLTSATLPLSLEPIEALRVVDQQRLLLRLGVREARDQVDEDAVVRDRLE